MTAATPGAALYDEQYAAIITACRSSPGRQAPAQPRQPLAYLGRGTLAPAALARYWRAAGVGNFSQLAGRARQLGGDASRSSSFATQTPSAKATSCVRAEGDERVFSCSSGLERRLAMRRALPCCGMMSCPHRNVELRPNLNALTMLSRRARLDKFPQQRTICGQSEGYSSVKRHATPMSKRRGRAPAATSKGATMLANNTASATRDDGNRKESEREFHNQRYGGEVDPRDGLGKWYAAVDSAFRQQIELIRRAPADTKILEYGCADGRLSLLEEQLAQRFSQFRGIDISDQAIARAGDAASLACRPPLRSWMPRR